MKEILVTTNDIQSTYKIIGPVFFSLSNKGLFSSQFDKLSKKYKLIIEEKEKTGHVSDNNIPWSNLVGDYMSTENDFDIAFVIAVEELKIRTANLGGDAIIGFKFDLDFDPSSSHEFFVRVTGTAILTNF